ncbi:hypothetical protein ACQP2T_49715 [Nonomuraea sp. CA-143628]|uniref:hypothetical protein n=1 Tax=Nonomuraea sp. CA-143628 TaxID=3239997 RepID=UPI003D90B9E5
MFHERQREFGRTLTAIQLHQQGHHGWSLLHQALDDLLSTKDAIFCRLLNAVWAARPDISDAHLVTLIGAAVRQIAQRERETAVLFDSSRDVATRLDILRQLVMQNEAELGKQICGRSNSFTGARRFLAPQLIIGGFAAEHQIDEVRFLDLGTGLGILPRQLNNEVVYNRFAKDLVWDPWEPEYRVIPLTVRYGVDAPPLPNMDWVRACYGPSRYYEERFQELMWSFEQTAGVESDVLIRELDMLDLPRLADFILTNQFNVVTCNFALFQYAQSVQEAVERCVVQNMASPGLFLTMNPSHALLRPGCQVRGRLVGNTSELQLADASDAHLIGTIIAGTDLPFIIGQRKRAGSE